jgi:hypothetical protein
MMDAMQIFGLGVVVGMALIVARDWVLRRMFPGDEQTAYLKAVRMQQDAVPSEWEPLDLGTISLPPKPVSPSQQQRSRAGEAAQ